MKLATFRTEPDGDARAGLVEGDTIVALAAHQTVIDVLAGAEPERTDETHAPDAVTLDAPVPAPGTVYAIGLNYAEHIRETHGQTPEQPIVFVKVAGSVTAPGGPVVKPDVVRRLDYEAELAIVIGTGGRIAGFTVADDVSARDLQGREPQWTRAKGADTFCPYGPWITTVDEVGTEAPDLQIRAWVNGELRQDSRTSDLIFGCPELVRFIGETCTLRPGDLILTGTPNGVGMGMDPPRFLEPGDTVRIEIESLGEIEHSIR